MKPLETTQFVVSPSIGTTIPNRSIAIFDTTVENWESLAAGVIPGTEVFVLHPQQDGVVQIGKLLANRSNIQALHLLSHGEPGGLYLGSVLLNTDNLDSYSELLQEWKSAFSDEADILLYGCNVAATQAGEAFLYRLSALTGANIAASDDLTGNEALGGDWELEKTTGAIAASLAFSAATMVAYSGVFSPEPEYAWAKRLGGTGTDVAKGITLDSSGNVYTTGDFSGTADFDPGAGTFNLTSTGGSYDGFISKLNPDGTFAWAKQLGGTSPEGSNSIAVDSSGNVYTTGGFEGTADFDPGAGTFNLTVAGSSDNFISKLNPDGTLAWAMQLGGTGIDKGNSIAVDSSGNVYTTGVFQGTADFDPGVGTFNLTSAGGYDSYISKLNPDGTFAWAMQLGGTLNDTGQSIVVDSSGNVYTTGNFNGTADFDPGAGTFNLTSAGVSDIFISKLNPDGTFAWAKQMGSTDNDVSYSIAVDSSGNVYTTGYFSGTADFDPGAGTFNLTSAGVSDSFISKLNPDGTFAWAKQLGGTAGDVGHSIAVDSSGNVYTTGYFAGTTDFDPGAGTFNLTSAGSNDSYISMLDPSGNFLWAKRLGGTASDRGNGIAVDNSGNVYTGGSFQGTADFDPGTGTADLTAPGGSSDSFISKLTPGVAPTVTGISSTIADGSYSATQLIPITVTFSEPVIVTGTPTLALNTGATATYTAGSGTNTLTFNYTIAAGQTTNDLDYTNTTALSLSGGTIKDDATNDAILTLPSPGAANSLGATKNLIVDTTVPTATSFTPVDNALTVAVGANLVLELSETVQTGTGNIVIKKVSDNSVVETIDVTSGNVTVTGSTVTINPTLDLDEGTAYYVEIAAGAIKDLANNNYAGITGATPWNFTTDDTTAPTATSFTPADNALTVAVGANLVLELSETVQTGTGNIVIKKVSDNSVVETLDVTSGNVIVSGSTVTINPTLDLDESTAYYVEIATGAIKDLANNNYAGITGATAWNFTTADTTAPVAPVIASMTTDSGTADDGITNDATLIFAGTAEADSTVTLLKDGTSIGTTTADASGDWTFDYTGTTLTNGTYNFTATATDAASNISTPSAPFGVTIDTTAPTVTLNQDPGQPDPTAGTIVNFEVVFSESVTGFDDTDITLGGTAGATTANVTGSGTTYNVAVSGMTGPGTITAAVNAGAVTDVAGNTSTASTSTDNEVSYDDSIPTVTSIVRADADPSNAATVNYTVTFSETVTGVNATDFSLAAGSIADAAITSVTGSGTSYTVAVDTGTSDGTVQLNLTDDDSIINSLSVPLGGAGTGNGSSTGQIYTLDKTGSSVTTITSSLANGSYPVGQVIPITVTFDEVVTVTGTPELTLNSGGSATYNSGSGTDTLTFNYTVATGESASDLETTALTLAGGTITDAAGNDATLTLPTAGSASSLGGAKNLIIDTTVPTVTLASTAASTVNAPFEVSATFSETVTGFAATDISVTNGTVSNVTGSGTSYSFMVTPTASGTVTVNVPTGGAADAAGNTNSAATALTRTADTTVPTVTLASTAASTVNAPFEVSATFSETVTGFAATDISVTNGTVSNVTGSGTSYSFMVTPTASGTVTVNVPTGGAADAAGNTNSAATALTRTADTTIPTVTLASTAASTVNAPFEVSATFSETVTGFAATDISVTNGTVSNLTGSGSNYSFTVTPTEDGTVTVNVPAGAAMDASGNSSSVAPPLTRTTDSTVPTVTLASTAAETLNAPFEVNATFSETVTGFTATDVSVTNGTVSNFSGSGSNYSFTVKPTEDGTVTVNVPAGAATDASGNSSSVAPPLTRTLSSTFSLWSELKAYLQNKAINVSTAVEQVLQNALNTIAPLTVEIEDSQLTATYNATGSLNDVLKALGVPVANGSSIFNASIANPSLTLNTSESSPAYNLSGSINGIPVSFGYQSGQAVTASYEGDVSLSDLLSSMGVSGTQSSSLLTGAIGNTSLTIDTSESPPAYTFSGNVSGKPISFEYQSGEGVTLSYEGEFSLSDLLSSMGVSGTQSSSILTGAIGNPSLTIDTSTSPAAYALSGSINGQTVSFDYQSGEGVTVSYEGDVSLSDLLSSMGVSGTQGSSILTGAIGNPSLTIDTSTSPAAYTLSGSINGQTVSFDYQSGQGVTVSYEGDISLSDLLNQVGFDSGGIGGEILDTPVKDPSLKIDTSKPTTLYTFSGEISGQNVSFSVDKTSIKFAYPNNASLKDLVDKIPVDAIKEIAQEVTPDLTSPYFTIDKSSGTPKYIASGKLDFATDDGQDNFFDFIKELGINNVTLNAEVSPPDASISANLGTDITLFKQDSFSAILKGLNLKGGLGTAGPSFGIDGSLILKGYDPFQLGEPDLTLFGGLNLEPESLTGSFALETQLNSWKNPFGLPNTEIRNLGFQVGGTYLFPYIDNIGLIADLKFGTSDLRAAVSVDSNDPDKFALELTVNQAIGFLDILAGPIFSYGLNQAAGQSSVIKRAADLFKVINNQITVVSIDSPNDDDTDLDPLIKFVPVETTIANTTLSQGVGINGELNIGGETAQLNLTANPFSSDPSLNASLTIPEINLLNGLIKIKGASQKDLTLGIKVDSDEQYIQGNGSLELFGLKATADFKITPTSVDINKSSLDLGIAKLAVDYLSVSLKDKSAKGKGNLTIFGQSVAGVQFEANSNGLKVENLNLGWGSLFSLNLDYLNLNSNGTGSAKGKVKLFGEELFTGDLALTNNSLTVNANLGYNILGKNVGVGVGITLGNSNKITLTADVPLLDYKPSVSISLDTAFNQFSSITDWLEDLVLGEIGRLADKAIEYLETGFNEVSKAATQAWNSLEYFFNNLSTSLENGVNDIQNQFIKWFGGDLNGNDNNNEINGTSNRDHIFGQGGNDKLLGHGGEDYIYGGWGNDVIYAGWGNDRLYGEGGNDFLAGEWGEDYIYGGSGVDLLDGGTGDDVLSGEDDNDRLSGGSGNDHLYGGPGADVFYGDSGNDYLSGERGNDRLHGGTDNDTLWGGSVYTWQYKDPWSGYTYWNTETSNDHLYGDEGNDYLYGEGGEDLLDGGSDNDILYGGGGNDRLLGQAGNDLLLGEGGNDELHGSYGHDVLLGGSGNDVLYGQQGQDLLHGQDGNDTLYGDDDGQQGQTYNGAGFSDNDTLYGDGGDDYLFGGTGQDYLYGGWGQDFLDGGSGNDVLSGESGNDILRGGDGNDLLSGGNGNNILSGGNGNDMLVSLLHSNDTIDGGAGDDTLVLVGTKAEYAITTIPTGLKIIHKPTGIVKIVSDIETFVYESTNYNAMRRIGLYPQTDYLGRVIDGYIADGQIFFDANLNGVLDENEPFTTTKADGTFDLTIDIEQFDTNQDTELDHTEGQLVLMGGVDIATGLPLVTPLTSTLRSTVVTPLTTIIANLVQQGTDPAAAETQVKSALGLSAEVELGSYDPLEAITNGETEGTSVFGSMIQVQNTIVQMAKFMEGVAETPLTQLAYSGIGAIANQLKGGTSVDLGNLQTIQSIFQDAITQAAKSDPNINPTQLAATAAAAAQIIALGNQMIGELVSSGASPTDIITDITKLQAVSVGEIAVGLPELAAGKVSIEEFLAKNTKEAILARMEAVKVNDPTSRTLDENNPLDDEDTPGSSQPQPFSQGLPSNGNSESSDSGENSDGETNSRNPWMLFFDADYYLAQNSDVAAAVETGAFRSAAEHFGFFGFMEGRAPSEMFAKDYLVQNSDVADAVINGSFRSGFEHFLKFGFAEGRFPSEVLKDFEMFYVSQHADAAEAVRQAISTNGLEHLVSVGFTEGRNPFPQFEILTRTFDSEYYLAQNADVAEAVQAGGFRSGMEHFVHFGMYENRDPSQAFSTSYYLANNADVAEAVVGGGFRSGYQHFMMHGMTEGRLGSATPIANLGNFDRLFVTEAGKDILTGMDENTATNPEADSLMSDVGADFFSLDNANSDSTLTDGEGELGLEAIANFNADADWLQLTEAGLLPGLNQQEGDRTDWMGEAEEVSVLAQEENAFSFV